MQRAQSTFWYTQKACEFGKREGLALFGGVAIERGPGLLQSALRAGARRWQCKCQKAALGLGGLAYSLLPTLQDKVMYLMFPCQFNVVRVGWGGVVGPGWLVWLCCPIHLHSLTRHIPVVTSHVRVRSGLLHEAPWLDARVVCASTRLEGSWAGRRLLHAEA